MRLARFAQSGRTRLGVVSADGSAIHDLAPVLPGLPASLRAVLEIADAWLPRIQRAVAGAPRLPLERVELLAPIPDPHVFLAVGLNYANHAREMGLELPKAPRVFTKLAGSIAGPRDTIVKPTHSDTLDYEGELALVIGRACRDVPRERAHEVIAGYMVVNDLSLRELVNPDLLVLGKGCDTFGVTGPWVTTADEVPDAHALRIRTWVNDELRQDSSTAELIFDCPSLVAWCSRGITLRPGDLITTGSPGGSGHGSKPPRYLQPGDRVRVEIEGLGALDNRVSAGGGVAPYR